MLVRYPCWIWVNRASAKCNKARTVCVFLDSTLEVGHFSVACDYALPRQMIVYHRDTADEAQIVLGTDFYDCICKASINNGTHYI